MKIKDMDVKQLRESRRKKLKEWRKRNPKRNKELRKKYKFSDKGIIANRTYLQTPKFKLRIVRYLKKYMEDVENHKKYLIRQNDYKFRKELINFFKKCQECGSKDHLEMHHIDYFKDKDIIILCRKCHRHLHRKNKSEDL